MSLEYSQISCSGKRPVTNDSTACPGRCIAPSTAPVAALAAGAPVVGYRTPDLDGVISNGESGILVAPGDRVALAGRTLDLLDDPVSRDRVMTAARAAAATRFPPGPVAAAVAAAYHAVSSQTS